jgi:hypothetical protein
MKFAATILALAPGLISVISDPDALGIGLLVVFILPLYVAWRTKTVGGIILILVGLLMLSLFILNVLSPAGIPPGFLPILSWIVFIVFPILSGILFILAGRKKLQKQPAEPSV